MSNFSREVLYDVYLKVTGKSDLEWSDICEKHNLNCHPDTLRKAGLGVKLAVDNNVIDFTSKEVKDYNFTYKGKINFYDQRRVYNQRIAAEARHDYVVNELVKAAQKAGEVKPLPYSDTFVDFENYENEAVLILTDWHYGMIADNVFGSYSPETARARIAFLRDRVIEKLRVNSVSRLNVVLGGDMCAGAIHVTNRVLSSEQTVDQLIHVSEIIAELIAELSNYVVHVDVYSVFGNHSRVTAKLEDSIHGDNYERFIPFWLTERFRGSSNISVNDGRCHEMVGFDVNGHSVCVVHGDLDGKNDSLLTLSMLYKKNYHKDLEVLFMGHFHHHMSTERLGIELIQSGCLCGTDEYAKNKRLFSRPSQTLVIFNNDGVDSIHNIALDGVGVSEVSVL